MSDKESSSSSEKQAAPQVDAVVDTNMDASEKKAEEVEVKQSESQSEKTTPEPAGSVDAAPVENSDDKLEVTDKDSKSESKDAKKDKKKEKEPKEKKEKPPKEEKPKEAKRSSKRFSIRGAPGVGTNVNFFSELVDPKKKNRRLLRTLVPDLACNLIY